MRGYPGLAGNKFYGDLNRLTSAIVALVDAYCDPKHHNGPACDWCGAILLMGVELASRTDALLDKAEFGEIRAQPLSRGGSAFRLKHNTRVLYSSVVTDSQDDRPLDSVKYPFFDNLHMAYLYNKMKKGEAVLTTKVCHDYILAFEDILFIVCEALSSSLEEEFAKIIMSLVKMPIYLDVAYGIISTGTVVYVIKLWWSFEYGKYHYQVYCLPYRQGNYKDRNAHGFYAVGCWEIIKIIAAIMWNQQLDIDRIIVRNAVRYPYVETWARESVPACTVFTKSCALYLGTDRMMLNNYTTLNYQKEVYFNMQSSIQAAQEDPNADPEVLGITLYQPGGVNTMIASDDVEAEEDMAGGGPRDGSLSNAVMEALTHSVLKTLLVEQKTLELEYVQAQVDMVNSQCSDSPASSRESLESHKSKD